KHSAAILSSIFNLTRDLFASEENHNIETLNAPAIRAVRDSIHLRLSAFQNITYCLFYLINFKSDAQTQPLFLRKLPISLTSYKSGGPNNIVDRSRRQGPHD